MDYTTLHSPKLSPTNNLRLFYCISIVVSVIFILLLVITGYTAHTVYTVSSVATNTQELIDDIHELLPESKKAIELLYALCKDANWTNTTYNNTKDWCNTINKSFT